MQKREESITAGGSCLHFSGLKLPNDFIDLFFEFLINVLENVQSVKHIDGFRLETASGSYVCGCCYYGSRTPDNTTFLGISLCLTLPMFYKKQVQTMLEDLDCDVLI